MQRFASTILWVLLLTALTASTVTAQQVGPLVTGVQPSKVSNASPVDLVVTGQNFMDGSKVLVENYGGLPTTFNSDAMLVAELPAGLPAGSYSVTVINPNSLSDTLENALTVEEDDPDDENDAARPLLVIEKYDFGVDRVAGNQEIDLLVKLHNAGQRPAYNVLVTFTPGDFVVRASGGVQAIEQLDAADSQRIEQPLTTSWDVVNKAFATLTMTVAYNDARGTAYTETFNINIAVAARSGSYATATPTPTATAVPVVRPQLVITSYNIDVPTLQPGSQFNLDLQVRNVGNSDAQRVTMIIGGGSSSTGGQTGTPEPGSVPGGVPGGVSGGSGDFGNFAPVSASNVQYLGDLDIAATMSAQAALIVNASTNPGAYPMKISFTYTADNGITYTDDQVVTLLVYSPPMVEVNFYRPVTELFAGQPNPLPLQVVNLSRKATVLGNMKVSAENAQFSNDSALVGALDPGGYFPMDAMMIPDQAGTYELLITIDYTDDFNRPQVLTKTMTLQVLEGMGMGPEGMPGEGMPGGIPGEIPGEGMGPGVDMPVDGGMSPDMGTETTWQKIVRFFRGLFGLDSSPNSPDNSLPGEMMPGEAPPVMVPIG